LEITSDNIILALLIFAARVSDVGLGTIRHALIIRGRKNLTFLIAFFEALIWVYAVSSVMSTIQDPLTSISFALGFASGTYVGLTIEGLLKIGEQVVRVFSRKGDLVAQKLRENGYRVTVFDGTGRDGVVKLLFVQIKRRKASKVKAIVRSIDPSSFMILDDIRSIHMADGSSESGADLLPITPLITTDEK
jgi:uncharacterized protein YebE (UPF0316 family)